MNLVIGRRIGVAAVSAGAVLSFASPASALVVIANDGLPACSASVASDCVEAVTVDGAPVDGLEPRVMYQDDALSGKTTAIYLGAGGAPYGGYAFTPAKCRTLLIALLSTPRPEHAPTAEEVAACDPKLVSELAPVGSVVRIKIRIGSRLPVAATIRGAHEGNLATPNRSWIVENTPSGNLLTVEFKPTLLVYNQALGMTNGCMVFPTPSPTACGGETGVADWEGVSPTMHLSQLDAGPWTEWRDLVDGLTVALNSQTNGPPIFDPKARSLTVQTGGVHFRKDGLTPNTGFISVFVPDHLAQAEKGFALPPGLSPYETLSLIAAQKTEAGKSSGPLDPTVTVRAGGILFDTPSFNFSSPSFSYQRNFLSSSFISKAKATKSAITAQLTTKAPGSVVATGLLGKTTVCSGSARGRTAGAIAVKCAISAAGKRSLGRKKNQKVTLRLVFTPLGGKPKTRSTTVKF
jgi:hypothetical protein